MKGGLFIISTPNAAKEPLSESFHRDHVRHYTKSELLAKLTEAGFTPIATYWRYHALGAKNDSILNRIGSKQLRQEQVQYGMTYWSVEHQSVTGHPKPATRGRLKSGQC